MYVVNKIISFSSLNILCQIYLFKEKINLGKNFKMVQWEISDGEVDYDTALEKMDNHVGKMISGEAGEKIWLLEHPPLYTAGTSAEKKDLVEPNRFPIFETKRGGQYTYHGPSQRVVYVMLDLNKRARNISSFVEFLARWLIATLQEFTN